MYSYKEIEQILKSQENLNFELSFSLLQSICTLANQDSNNNNVQLLVLRVLDRIDTFEAFSEIINNLVRQFGLYPYLNTDILTIKEAIARELHRPALLIDDNTLNLEKSKDNFVFHRIQAEVFRYLMNGENVILSAPTSFGKSALIDALIESNKFNNIIVVVPTIALIDETRRRLSVFKGNYKIITHASQEIQSKNIFILTQERVVDFPNLPTMDIFILDEFYKLDPREDEERAMTLNHAFYKLHKISKQFYLLGPNIQNIPNGFPERFNCRFIRTDFATVVTETTRVNSNKGKKLDELLSLCHKLDEATLIYCASPSKARQISKLLAEKCSKKEKGLPELAQWIGEHYHPDWTLVQGLNCGIGMHHGRMPRALAQLCVQGFNEGKLPFLVCTSTLIEGVNTKAKNVIIFDNKIANKKYDFFTFNNIKGRSGRMFQHFIGNVYIFNEPPQENLPLVDIPIFSQDETASDSLLIQLDDNDMSRQSFTKIERYHKQEILSIETIRQNVGIEPKLQLELAEYLIKNLDACSNLAWEQYPTYEQLGMLCEIICNYFINNTHIGGIKSYKQLTFKINQLKNYHSIKAIILESIKNNQTHDSPDEILEQELNFIRQWAQFHFPHFAMAVCRIQNEIAKRFNRKLADYTLFSSKVENLFSDPALIALDEYGIPFPLAKKLENHLYSDGNLDKTLEKLSSLDVNNLNLTNFEKQIILDAQKTI